MAKLACGIVGLPNVGKSTLFNAVTKAGKAAAENYPFCTIDPNVAGAEVPDGRLAVLAEISKSQKVIPSVVEFVDIAGLVKGASKGEGLGNKFLSNIRETHAILHVVRCFDGDVVHVEGKVDPIADIETINLELILADLQMAENALVKVAKQARLDKDAAKAKEQLEKVIAGLNENKPVRMIGDFEELKAYPFLTAKKVLYVANVGEGEMDNAYVQQVREYAAKEGSSVVPICARLEEELAQLEDDERDEYLKELGLKEPGLHRLIKASFSMLGLITFLTTGEQETRSWTIREGTSAPEAAGTIHTDLQKGFIRAEVVKFDDFVSCGGRVKAKEQGLMRAEGKEYTVVDGDVILFLHG